MQACLQKILTMKWICWTHQILAIRSENWKKLDHSDGNPWLSETEYDQLDRIRELRNYWCHQCYLDYIYINVEWQRENKFQRIANRLYNEHGRVYNLHQKLQDLYFDWFEDSV